MTIEDMIAGNPRRAMEELSMRAKLEVVRGEVEATLKMHSTMAKGERTSWLKQIERQNEENAYQVHVVNPDIPISHAVYMCIPFSILRRTFWPTVLVSSYFGNVLGNGSAWVAN